MRTSAPGSEPGARAPRPARAAGFTLIELLVVVAIVAVATAGVAFALRDSGSTRLEREADRLSALFEAARAQSRASGLPVTWQPVAGGFRFTGLPGAPQAQPWLDPATVVAAGPARIVLGPEPVIGPQALVLANGGQPGRSLRIATDGVRPFVVEPAP
jgi:general secretion pathway protein H